MNEKNLIPFDKMPKSEHKKLSSKGGVQSGKTRSLKAKMKKLMALDVADDEIKGMLEAFGIEETDMGTAMLFMQLWKAVRTGDTNAYRAVMETVGESVRHEELAIKKKELRVKEAELKAKAEERKGTSSFENILLTAYEKRKDNGQQ